MPRAQCVSRLLSYCSLGTRWNGIWLAAISGSNPIVIGRNYTPFRWNCGLADGSMKSKLAFVRQPDSIPRKTAFSLRCFAAILLPTTHRIRTEKADWKQKHFQSACLFIRQISFQLMLGLLQLEVRCTLQLFHKAYHLPTLPTRVWPMFHVRFHPASFP